MRIAILAHTSRVAGGLSVGLNLLSALARQGPEHEYLITYPPGVGYEEVCAGFRACRAAPVAPRGGQAGLWWYETFRLPKIVRVFRPDVLLSLTCRGLTAPPCSQAILGDDSHLFYPQSHFQHETFGNKLKKQYHKRLLGKYLRRTDLLLCQTATAERRLRETYSFRGRTAICLNAVSVFSLTEQPSVALPTAVTGLGDKMRLLYVTKFYGHKNFEGILDLFDRYRTELKDVAIILTVAPDQHPHAPRFLRAVRRRGLADRIIIVGPLPQSALGGYYHHCQALFMPTFLESFSATYLEAMHFGLPILTSDLDFAHEICGAAALYFDPWRAESMRDAILRLKGDAALAADLAAKGRLQLGNVTHSWDDVARKLIQDLASVVADKRQVG